MISVVTPSVRPEMLKMVEKCLQRQSFKDFEWIIITPSAIPWMGARGIIIHDPPKREGDFYRLNGAWNYGFKKATGDLIISIQDGIWFPPDMLQKFWDHYQNNPKSIVGAIGHQYEVIENGKPEQCVWKDPRQTTTYGTFYECTPKDVEWSVCSIPKQALLDVGGLDEEFDKYAALSEKECNIRMDMMGYKTYLDQSIEYRALHHPRLSKDWDDHYFKGCEYFDKCIKEILNGTRKKLDYL